MAITPAPSNSHAELQRMFEAAVQQARNSDRNSLWYRTPIARRPNRVVQTPVENEKRALSSAAQALSQLWKVSPHFGR